MKKLIFLLLTFLMSLPMLGQVIKLDAIFSSAISVDSSWQSADVDTLYFDRDSVYVTADGDTMIFVVDDVTGMYIASDGSNASVVITDTLKIQYLASDNTVILSPTSTGNIDTLETTDLATEDITVTGLWTFDNLVADSIQVDSMHVNSHAQIDDVTISAGTATLTSLVSGTITGGTMICLHTVAKYVFTDLDSCRNVAHFNDQASVIDFTLPGATAGLTVAFFDIGGGVITIDPVDGTDTIYLNGESVGAGDAIDSPGNVGDFIVLQAIDDTRWITWGRSGVFVDGGAD